MIQGGKSGVNTKTGLFFEKNVDLIELLKKIEGYEVRKERKKAGYFIYFNGELVARSFKKYDFYRFLEENGINYQEIISKKLLPDDSLLVIVRDTLFIIEVKFQNVAGSTDEKLQTCDFKKKQYQKLVKPLGLKLEYIYVLNDWFKKPEYKDTLDYIESVNCHYVFNEIPLSWLGLP